MSRKLLYLIVSAFCAAVGLLAVAMLWLMDPLDIGVERAWYRLLLPAHTSAAAQNIVRIDLDGADARAQLAKTLRVVARHRPAAVGVLLDLSEPAESSTRELWGKLEDYAADVGKKMPRTSARLRRLAKQGRWLDDRDGRLAEAIRKTPGIYLAMWSAQAEEAKELEAHLVKPALLGARGLPETVQVRQPVRPPLAAFVEEASGVGDASIAPDDGRKDILRVRLISPMGGRWVPTLPLLLAVKKAVGHTQSIRVELPGKGISYGDFRLPVDRAGRLMLGFTAAPNGEAFPVLSASEVLAGKLGWRQLKDKIVLIGLPEAPRWDTPAGWLTDRELIAHAIAAVIDSHYFVPHRQSRWIASGLLLALLALLALAIARLPLWISSIIAALMATGLVALDAWLLLVRHIWLPLGLNLSVVLLAFVVLFGLRLFADHQVRVQRESAAIRRDLGLMHQQRGNLDKALTVFVDLPPDPESFQLMYRLGKEFERKRRFHHAVEAYDWILARDPDYRDTQARRNKASQLEAAGMTATGTSAAPLLIEGMDHKPTLGRYEIEKLIGQGAMGEVYLGRDPSIGRVVAIKTLPLASEFEPEELDEIRSRFFHEAAAAGRLNHTNIVTIYDVGEEHDLAFMAMEYIDGYSLNQHAKPGSLLPIERVVRYIADTADALDYAHGEGIVHRDVKPANLMIDKAKDLVKITDFGIARITSSSRTKTGMLLGTPSYMSPEQAMGHPVDHRADIFSLGTTLFVLLTGQKPFPGDSLAAISYQIIHEKHPDVRKLNPNVPQPLKRIIDKALQKNPDDRYQSAAAMARELRKLLKD